MSKDGKAALRERLFCEQEGKQMRPKARILVELDNERSRKRALWCRQLAEGTGNLQFAIKLKDLSQEYDGLAELKETKTIKTVAAGS